MLGRLPEKFRLKISYQERHGPVPAYQQKLERFWPDYVRQTNLIPALWMLIICVFLMWVTFGPLNVEQPWQNLWIEFGGLTFDVFFILVVFSLFEHRRQNRQDIERQKEIIGDYKSWDSEEARFRIAGALRRLSKRGVHAIDFSGARLSDFSFSKAGIESLHGANFFDGVWGEFFKDSRVKLQRVNFSFLDCRDIMFSPFDPLSGLGGEHLRHTHMTDCTFIQSKLQGASFNGAALTWTEAPPADLYEVHYDENGEYESSSQIAYSPFDQADLAGTSFASVFFKNADFRNADGILAADFTGAQGLEEAHFDTDEIKREVIKMSRANSTTTDTGKAK
tara:strand:- start:780 stop:1787 length:1008 start_codon:yes stop_codon:yes gene_type:complete